MTPDTGFRIPLALGAFLIFVVGLTLSFMGGVGNMFGVAPHLFWPLLFVLFLMGVVALRLPKLYLVVMFIYYGFFPNAYIFGHMPLPIPFARIIDDLFLAIPIGIIMMQVTRGEQPKGITAFPIIYLVIAAISYKANSVPTMNAMRVVLAYSKFFIFWYFARSIGPWTRREKYLVVIGLIAYAMMQFVANVALWQKHIVARYHQDASIGTIGNAHTVGYVSVLALLFLAGWLFTMKRRFRLFKWAAAGGIGIIISYNLIFLTDTKHALLMVPIAALPFLVFPKFPVRFRALFVVMGLLFCLASFFYLSGNAGQRDLSVYTTTIRLSGKGSMLRALIHDIPGETDVPFIGVGPGNFCSAAALGTLRPLAVKYVLPYTPFHRGIVDVGAVGSVVGGPQTSFFTLWGEFGPIVLIAYYGFWFYVLRRLWREALEEHTLTFETGQRIALISCLLFVIGLSLIVDIFITASVILPLWILVGINWKEPKPIVVEATRPAPQVKRVIY